MKKKVYLTGANGFFGSNFQEFFGEKFEIIKGKTDIRNFSDLKAEISFINPDLIVNCAGKTGIPNVDWCESHKEETASVNIAGAINLATISSEKGIYMVHFGSGCVYEGNNGGKGFSEEDEPNFYGSFYSRTKIFSEKVLKEFKNILQLRVRIPISIKSSSKNVIDKLIKYEKIISVNNSFTVVEDLFETLEKMIENKETGVFNMTNEGFTDHKFIMENYSKIVNPDKKFIYFSLEDLGKVTKAERSNTFLNTSKLEEKGYKMRNIEERVLEILKKYGK